MSEEHFQTARDASCSRTHQDWGAGRAVMARAGVLVSSTAIVVFEELRTGRPGGISVDFEVLSVA